MGFHVSDWGADALEFAVDNGADIISNSWGYNSSNQNLHPVIVTAINHALTNNVIVIFAAGNTANHENNQIGTVNFPANVNLGGVITVGASDRNDSQANYSPTNSLIDIVAPSHRAYPNQITGETFEMWSIDIPGNAGYNPWPVGGINPPAEGEELPDNGINIQSYTGRFGGTSHSCPVVAGVAALMLSINPDLNYMDAFDILTNTADKVGGYTYTIGRCNEMGYGRVNAFNAVTEMINRIIISGPSVVCYSGSTYTASNAPLGSTISWTTSSNLTIQSGGSTSTPTIKAINSSVYGLGTIQIHFTSNGSTIDGPELEVWVGKPATPTILGPTELYCDFAEWYFIDAESIQWQIFQWSVNGSLRIISASTGFKCRIEATDDYGGDVYVEVFNDCGSSEGRLIVFTECFSRSFSIYPNPAADYVNISVSDDIIGEIKANKAEKYELTLYDKNQQIRFNKKSDEKLITVNTKHLTNGSYYLHFKYKGKTIKEQIMISK